MASSRPPSLPPPPLPPFFYYVLALLPPATAGIALYVIMRCAELTFAAGILPADMRFPPISLFSLRPGSEEQTLYTYGFPLVALLFFCSLLPIRAFLLEFVERDLRGEVTTAIWTAIGAFVGLAVHGIYPLHEDILLVLKPGPGGRGGGGGGGGQPGADPQSMIHQLAAMVFFMLSLYHGYIVTKLLWNSKQLPNALTVGGAGAKLGFAIKASMLAGQFAPSLISLVMHPASKQALGLRVELSDSDIGGLTQWWTVGCLIVLYTSYAVDLVVIGAFYSSAEKAKAE